VGTLTLLNELGRRVWKRAPRIEVLGERAVGRIARRLGFRPDRRERYALALAGELASDGTYFALAGLARRRPLVAGLLLGAVAGAAALATSGPLGLGTRPTRRTATTAALTVAWYVAAGLAAGLAARRVASRPPPATAWPLLST
jgi:hypothetical protein